MSWLLAQVTRVRGWYFAMAKGDEVRALLMLSVWVALATGLVVWGAYMYVLARGIVT